MKCPYCAESGTVTMEYTEHRYTTVFACTCQKGAEVAAGMNMARWRGYAAQQHRGETYRLLFPEILARANPANNNAPRTESTQGGI